MALPRRSSVTLLAIVAALGVTVARAADPKPVPGCTGLAFVDKKGDQSLPNPPFPAGPNTDILSGFFTYEKAADGKMVLAANLVIDDLSTALWVEGTTLEYRMVFTVGEDPFVAGAFVSQLEEVTYFADSTFVDVAPIPAATTGKFIEGKDGVIQVVIPDTIAKAGAKLTAVSATSRANFSVSPRNGAGYIADTAPDTGAGTDFEVKECPAAEPTVAATPTPTPPPVPVPTQAPAPTATPLPPPYDAGGASPQPSSTAARKTRKRPTCLQKTYKIRNAKQRKAALKRCRRSRARRR